MTKEGAEAVAIVVDRMTRPIVTVLFCASICYMGVRTVQNISADQFVGIVMAVVMFWFGSRPTTASSSSANGSTTTTTDAGATTTVTKP